MKIPKFIILLFTTTLFAGVFLFVFSGGISTESKPEEKFSAFESALQPIYGSPKRLIISAVDLKVDIKPVGIDLDGYLETPNDWYTAGWYRKSARPAEVGNLIINAHYDDSYGNPAAFWVLKDVNLNDTVTVLDSFGKAYDYKVTGYSYIDINDPDRLKVFEKESEIPALTLITCGGVWAPLEGTYSKRLVVNAELIPRQ